MCLKIILFEFIEQKCSYLLVWKNMKKTPKKILFTACEVEPVMLANHTPTCVKYVHLAAHSVAAPEPVC